MYASIAMPLRVVNNAIVMIDNIIIFFTKYFSFSWWLCVCKKYACAIYLDDSCATPT